MLSGTIIIRCAAGANTGMGHLVRCSALAGMLTGEHKFIVVPDSGFNSAVAGTYFSDQTIVELPALPLEEEVTCIRKSLDPGVNHLWILDGYNFTAAYEQDIISNGDKLLTVDDLANRKFFAHAILNLSDFARDSDYDKQNYTQVYTGSKYALLRKPFLDAATKQRYPVSSVKEVMVNMGGVDLSNITEKAVHALLQDKTIKKIHAVIGTLYPSREALEMLAAQSGGKIMIHTNLPANEFCMLMSRCQLAICPASGVSYELAAAGVAMLSGYTEDNQLGLLQTLEHKGAVINAGNFKNCSVADIATAVNSLVNNIELVNKLRINQARVIDGRSPERIKKIIKQLMHGN